MEYLCKCKHFWRKMNCFLTSSSLAPFLIMKARACRKLGNSLPSGPETWDWEISLLWEDKNRTPPQSGNNEDYKTKSPTLPLRLNVQPGGRAGFSSFSASLLFSSPFSTIALASSLSPFSFFFPPSFVISCFSIAILSRSSLAKFSCPFSSNDGFAS